MGRQYLLLALVVAAGGCGDDGPAGPKTLSEDPAVVSGCQTSPPAAGQSRAKWIECPDELPAGRLVSGRVGDVLLENDRVKVVIRGFGEGYYLMGTGPGGIVDAARHGAVDQVKEIVPVFGLKGSAFDELVITEAGDDGPATLVVRGPLASVPFIESALVTAPANAIAEQHYILEPDADYLLIRTVLFDDGSGSKDNIEVGDAMFFGGVIQSWVPGRGILSGSTNVPFVASVGGGGTSYGIVYPRDNPPAVQFADVANIKLSLGITRTVGNPEPIDRWLVIGDGSSASVTERAWLLRGDELGEVTGTTAAGVDIEVSSGGDPFTTARANDSGTYRVALPAGSYQLAASSPGHGPGTASDVTVAAGDQLTRDLTAGGSGTLALSVVDDGGTPLPARAVITWDSDRRIEYAGADGTLELSLPPGDYTLDVSRGVEYDAFTVDPLTITDGATETVQATLTRVVDTAGWIALDTHIHSEMSTDSQITLDARLLAVAAEGVEVPISTDHDFVTDYAPVVAELGLSDFLIPMIGCETSSLMWGHVNSWPLTPDYDKGAGHAIPWYERSPGQVFALMRERGDGTVVQVNHPNSSSSGFFRAIDFNAETVMAEADPDDLGLPADVDLSDFDFDAIEVANDFNSEQFTASFRDWLALVAAGHPAVATGSSDSHGRSAYIGNSRTYVYVGAGNDDPATIDTDAINLAIKQRKVVVSQGAFVTAAIVDPGTAQPAAPGAMVDLGGESDATVQIDVQAPPWMPLARIVIYAGREIAATINLDAGDTQTVRYSGTAVIPIGSADGLFVVLVEPAGRGDPVLGQPDGSFTNPLLFDADGDGSWTP